MNAREPEDGILSRWAKRKADVRAEKIAEETGVREAVEEANPQEPGPQDGEPDAQPATEDEAMEMLRERDPELAETIQAIDIEELTYEDDFQVFMNEKVPEFLRRKALSKLWMSNPILANVDGLNDYDDDFTDAATVIENMQSSWQVGRGHASDEDEDDDQAAVASRGPDAKPDDAEQDEDQPGEDEASVHGEAEAEGGEADGEARTISEGEDDDQHDSGESVKDA